MSAAQRRTLVVVLLAGLFGHGICGESRARAADLVRLAVAPFSLELPEPVRERALAQGRPGQLLAERLALEPGLSVLPPSAPGLSPGAEPDAGRVRELAERIGFDALVLGRLSAVAGDRLVVDLRMVSGRSGAVLARHRRTLEARTPAAEAGSLAKWVHASWRREGAPPAKRRAPVSAAGQRAPPPVEPLFAFGGFDDRAPIEIRSESLELLSLRDPSERHLIFRRGVRVTQGDVVLEADELEAFYSPSDSQPEKLLARGHVRLRQGGRRARCDRATYLRAEQTLRCEGRAELVADCDVVRGDRIEFDLRRDQARVEGAASVVLRSRAETDGRCSEERQD